jgi:hypothetical protein
MAFNIEMIEKVYKEIKTKVDKAKELTQKPLTLSEKILYSHLWSDNLDTPFTRGKIMSILHQIELLVKMLQLKWPCCSLCKLGKKRLLFLQQSIVIT